jgi:hypothetical protein
MDVPQILRQVMVVVEVAVVGVVVVGVVDDEASYTSIRY